jgi:hypothetical protein
MNTTQHRDEVSNTQQRLHTAESPNRRKSTQLDTINTGNVDAAPNTCTNIKVSTRHTYNGATHRIRCARCMLQITVRVLAAPHPERQPDPAAAPRRRHVWRDRNTSVATLKVNVDGVFRHRYAAPRPVRRCQRT